MITPETLTRHELNGLPVRVAAAANPDLVGIAGRIVGETMQTVRVDVGTRVKQVPKQGVTFEFALPAPAEDNGTIDEAAGSASGATRRRRKAPGSASELPWDTAGRKAGQSGGCEGVVYVTVDGSRLLSRPALRTERAGDSIWH